MVDPALLLQIQVRTGQATDKNRYKVLARVGLAAVLLSLIINILVVELNILIKLIAASAINQLITF